MKPAKFFDRFVLTAVALFLVIFLWQTAHTNFKYSAEFKNLEAQFDSVKTIESAKKLGERARVSKVIKQVVSEDYISNLPAENIIDYYDKQLRDKGWKKKFSSENKYIFCMNDLDATIEVINPMDGRFNFEMRWEGAEAVRTGCVK